MPVEDFSLFGENSDEPDLTLAGEEQSPHPVGKAPKPDNPLDTIDKRVVNYCEQIFWETGLVPTPERVSDELSISLSRVQASYRKDTFKSSLATRGIDLTPEISGKVLDPRQILLANLLLNLHDRRSLREKLQLVKVSTQQYNAWMRQPQFIEFLRKRGEHIFKGTDHEAYLALTKAVNRGDVNALKLFFEMRGIYNPRLQIDVNIEAVMLRVVEIIAKRVTDPVTLEAIASELETVMLESGARSASPVGNSIVEATGRMI